MTTKQRDLYSGRSPGQSVGGHEPREARSLDDAKGPAREAAWGPDQGTGDEISPARKAAIVLVSLDQSLASQLLSHLDRPAVEAVTWEIARLEHVDPAVRAAVLEEFYGLGLRRLCFVFDDLTRMSSSDIRSSFHIEDVESWALALAGASAPARAKVMGALEASTANQLRQHLEGLGPFRLSDSEGAQVEITDLLRRLYDRGRISLPEPSAGDEVLV
jgi:flagellar motor switch protein FliG